MDTSMANWPSVGRMYRKIRWPVITAGVTATAKTDEKIVSLPWEAVNTQAQLLVGRAETQLPLSSPPGPTTMHLHLEVVRNASHAVHTFSSQCLAIVGPTPLFFGTAARPRAATSSPAAAATAATPASTRRHASRRTDQRRCATRTSRPRSTTPERGPTGRNPWWGGWGAISIAAAVHPTESGSSSGHRARKWTIKAV